MESGKCGRGPWVLCLLVPRPLPPLNSSRGTLILWPCLLQSGETALHVAARYGHADVVQLLCSFGSNPNFQDKVGRGPCCLHSLQLFAWMYRQPIDAFGSLGVLARLDFLLR